MPEQRRPAPVEPPVTLTVAGSDSGGGAGVQADLKTLEAFDTFATSVLTNVTAQNTRGVESVHAVPVPEVEAQFDAVRSDFALDALKTGMLGTAPIVETVEEFLGGTSVAAVVDPVMVAASGDRLLDEDAEAAYESLLGEATVVTPNAEEATLLTGVDVTDVASMTAAAETLRELGADAALVTGGHVETGANVVRDVLVTETGSRVFEGPRVDTDATHGSGCTLSSAVAARLAHGDDVETAVENALAFMRRAVRYPVDVGEGPGTVQHLARLRERADARETQEVVESVVSSLSKVDAGELVPEVGMNVVGATPLAEVPDETVAVEGRITRTGAGPRPNRGTRFGASSHVARFLLAAREHDADLRFAANVGFDETLEPRLAALDGAAVETDRSEEPAPDEEGSTMGWTARRAFERTEGTPAAVYDRGAVGKEPMVRLLAATPDALVEHLQTLAGQ